VAKKNPHLCSKCQLGGIGYKVRPDGRPLKHGICRDCYERDAGSGHTAHGAGPRYRSPEMMEDTHETTYGPRD